MCGYLLASSNEDRQVHEQRVISSGKEVEQNPITQKSVLQLILPHVFTKDLNKGKGLVFSYDKGDLALQSHFSSSHPKLMASAISAGQSMINPTTNVFCRLTLQVHESSMVQQLSYPLIFSSKATTTQTKSKRTPGRYMKTTKPLKNTQEVSESLGIQARPKGSVKKKRKAEGDLAGASKATKSNASMMVPRERPSNA
ncbi:uncharacterized protein LOC106424864 [Brassica napus]|uniref:uncharacterized protein LOC106424864 n=1 Tax=Brassica napus TaxID=3708 RepID=UPI0006AA9278|nr:uncharacterized protein LOC106424864 [Brassica napus]